MILKEENTEKITWQKKICFLEYSFAEAIQIVS